MMISALLSRLVILVFGTLYPAYSSYKAVKTKDLKLYVKWMMYWIVFALFTAAETFTDIFLSFWFPFYYEFKICIVIWLLSPMTRGSSIMYRKVIHPLFMRREQEIDDMIAKAKDQGYNVILDIGCKGMTLATSAIMNTAVKGGTGLLFQLRKSYSLNDLITSDITDNNGEIRRSRKIKDCQNNFRENDTKETRMLSAESQEDLDATEDEFRHKHVVSRKSSCESITLEKDCKDIRVNLRPRKSNRQGAQRKELIPSNPVFPYYPYYLSRQSYAHSPFLYYPSITSKNNYLMPTPCNFNFNNTGNEFYENFLDMKIISESSQDLKKANSTPDISLLESTSNWMVIDSNPSKQTNSACEKNDAETPRRRKRIAPKPPSNDNVLNVPTIFVNSSNLNQTAHPRNEYTRFSNDTNHLKPKRKQKSKIQRFLSKSRELLNQWKTESDYDSNSVRSETADGSSDDSISTASSYNTVN